MPARDPRIYFAAERTLLAWVRTGVTIIGLGFVVARFGLFLRLVQATPSDAPPMEVSAALGTTLVILGGVLSGLAGLQFARFVGTLTPEEKPPPAHGVGLGLVAAFAISSVGLMLAIYLLL